MERPHAIREGMDMRMTFVGFIVVLFLVGSFGTLPINGTRICSERIQLGNEAVILSEKRPELGLEYARAARFRLASRKTTYHLGEMMNVDSALLNISGRSAFFRQPKNSEFAARDRRGNEVGVTPYVTASSDITRKSFSLLQRDEILTNSTQLLVGCNERVFKDVNAALMTDDDRILFDRNLFVNQGYGCINVKHAGTYSLVAEESNEYVVVSSGNNSTLTVVGGIQSNYLTITVTK